LADNQNYLGEISRAGEQCGAVLTDLSWDGSSSNTLIMPDKRDEIWLELDGQALYGLGHIASIHFNIDLVSVEEGMRFISRLMPLFEKQGWPPQSNSGVWNGYLRESRAKYQEGRYGPPPTDFCKYCSRLASYAVVMNSINGRLEIAKPRLPFANCSNPNIDMFLRSVWWWMRLRVRGGKLVLEIRDVPRTIPTKESFDMIRNCLDI